MRRRVINAGPLRGKASSDEQKYKVGDDPLQSETLLREMVPTSSQQHNKMMDVVNKLLEDTRLTKHERNALVIWKTNLVASTVEPHVKKMFIRDFWAWLVGQGTPEDVRKTFWGPRSLADDEEVEAYVSMFPAKMQEYRMKLYLLANRRPIGINECYLYFKYIVRGEENLQNGFSGDFLSDWKTLIDNYDIARSDRQAMKDPEGGPHEMAPYGQKRAEAGARRHQGNQTPSLHGFPKTGGGGGDIGADSDGDDSDSSDQPLQDAPIASQSQEQRVQRTRHSDPEVSGVHRNAELAAASNALNTAAAAFTSAAKEFAAAQLTQTHPAIVQQAQAKFEAETRQRITELESREREQTAKHVREKAEYEAKIAALQAAGTRPPETIPIPMAPARPSIPTEERTALQAQVQRSLELVQRVEEAHAARETTLEKALVTTTQDLSNVIKGLQQDQAKTAATIGDMSRLLEATGTIVQNMRTESLRAQEAFRSGSLDRDAFLKGLEKHGAQISQMMEVVNSSERQIPLLIEGLKAAHDGSLALIQIEAQKQIVAAKGDEKALQAALAKDSTREAHLANRQKVQDMLQGMEMSFSFLGPHASNFPMVAQNLRQQLQAAVSGISFDDASKYLHTMFGALRESLEQVKQGARSEAVAEYQKIPDLLRLPAAQQRLLLQDSNNQLTQAQAEVIRLISERKSAEEKAAAEVAKAQALETERERARAVAAERQVAVLEAALKQQNAVASQAQQTATLSQQAAAAAVQNLQITRVESEQVRQQVAQDLERSKVAAATLLQNFMEKARGMETEFRRQMEASNEAQRQKDAELADLKKRLAEERRRLAEFQEQPTRPRLEGAAPLPQLPGPAAVAALEQRIEKTEEEKQKVGARTLEYMRALYLRTKKRAEKLQDVGFPQLQTFDEKATAEELYAAVQNWKELCNDKQAWVSVAGTDVLANIARKKAEKRTAEKRTAEMVQEEAQTAKESTTQRVAETEEDSPATRLKKKKGE